MISEARRREVVKREKIEKLLCLSLDSLRGERKPLGPGYQQTGNRTVPVELANRFHPTIKFTVKISDKEATFLDKIIYKGAIFYSQSILQLFALILSRLKLSIYTLLLLSPTRRQKWIYQWGNGLDS